MAARPIETPSLRLAQRPLSPPPPRLPLSPSKNWPLVVALFDQGAVSLGNFVTNVLLARSLPVEQYGVFALFLDAILFLNSLQAALLIYPLTVRCPLMDENELRRCAGTCVFLTLIMAIPLGVALAVYGIFIGAASIAVWAVLGQTLWQCQETLRRTLLARRSYGRALVGDIISYLGQATIIALFVWGNKADVSRAFMAMAVTSLAAAIVQGFQVGVKPTGITSVLKTGRHFWLIGRWVMTANLTTLVTGVCCSYTLARSHGDASMGQYAALSNLLRIANPMFITLATLIVPAVALVSASGNHPRMLADAWRVSRGYALRGVALLLPYWLLLLAFPNFAISLLYHGRPQYAGLGLDLRIFVGISTLTLINAVFASTFNGLRRNRRALMAQVIGAASCLVLTIPLTVRFGLQGLLTGMLVSNAAVALSLIVLYYLLMRELSAATESEQLPSNLLVVSGA